MKLRIVLRGRSSYNLSGTTDSIWRRWQILYSLDELLYADARKGILFSHETGFGVDGSNKEKLEDFEGVRGILRNNPFVSYSA